jgi:hypothetical protein
LALATSGGTDISIFWATLLIVIFVFLSAFWYFRRRAAITLLHKENQELRRESGLLNAVPRENNLAWLRTFLRIVFALTFFLWSIPFLLFVAVAIPKDSIPVLELSKDKLGAIAIASRYISEHHSSTGRYPTSEEFRAWEKNETQRNLTMSGKGLSYLPPFERSQAYSFEFWDGDCNSTWQSIPAGSTNAYIDPECVFMPASSKLGFLIWCFGFASMFLGISFLIAKPLLPAKRR